MSSNARDEYRVHTILRDLEDIMNTHISMLKSLRIACIKVKKGTGSAEYVEQRVRSIRRLRARISDSLKNIESIAENVGENTALEIVTMVTYIEMSAIRDEKRYLRIVKKILREKGLSIDITGDLYELDELARYARKIIERYSGMY
jgi:uncharacterized protein YigA (DUF484 family)